MAKSRKRPRWISFVSVHELVPADRNPKLHVDLGPSFDRFDFTEPGLICERKGQLAAGHGRRDKLLELAAAGASPVQVA